LFDAGCAGRLSIDHGLSMTASASLPPHGLSFVEQIKNADPVVQAVMLVLVLCSLLCWTIAIEKLMRFIAFSRQLRNFERLAAETDASPAPSWLADRFSTLANKERRHPAHSLSEFQAALERSFQTEAASHLGRLQAGLPLLATVGSTAPFVGLFGTVWGIMNSFSGIAAAKDTSIAVVAPGIAEALLATAMGLAAAIPAVVFYNQANVALARVAERLSAAVIQFAKALAYSGVHGASSGDGQA
jgi:biopolymer transport protein ExbB/TolQ